MESSLQQEQDQEQQGRMIPVVYYLYRDHILEHPHFIQVAISSTQGLYLRDVINRLNVLRGMGMPALYSWSCKRSYKNGFIWQDLCEDDLVLPGPDKEYVLKGSELLDQSPSDRLHAITSNQNPEHPQQEPSIYSTASSSSSSSSSSATIIIKGPKTPSPLTPPQEDLSPTSHPSGCSGYISLQPRARSLAEYRVYNEIGVQDASTQTEDRGRRKIHGLKSRMMGISTNEGPQDVLCNNSQQDPTPESNEIDRDEISPTPALSSSSSPSGNVDTLESLIRDEVRKMNSTRILEEDVLVPTRVKLKAANFLMQLITCGLITMKDHHRFGFIPNFKARFSHEKSPATTFASSMMMREFDCLSLNSRAMGMKVEDKDHCSGDSFETIVNKKVGEGLPTLTCSSFYNKDRSCKSPDSEINKEIAVVSASSNCIPQSIKITSCRLCRNEADVSPISDAGCPSARLECSNTTPSEGINQRIADVSMVKGSSMTLEVYEEEKVIKIEERLSSGARVIIHSITTCNKNEESIGS